MSYSIPIRGIAMEFDAIKSLTFLANDAFFLKGHYVVDAQNPVCKPHRPAHLFGIALSGRDSGK